MHYGFAKFLFCFLCLAASVVDELRPVESQSGRFQSGLVNPHTSFLPSCVRGNVFW